MKPSLLVVAADCIPGLVQSHTRISTWTKHVYEGSIVAADSVAWLAVAPLDAYIMLPGAWRETQIVSTR